MASDFVADDPGLFEPGPAERDAFCSVAALLRRVNTVFSQGFSGITVEGEIHSIKRAPSGHIYFDLKDKREEAQISCALFRTDAARLARLPQVGDLVHVTGALNVYAPRGSMTFIARKIVPAGLGDLYAEFLRLKEKLQKEGLFDEQRKRPLPRYPETIGIITSPQAAALQDVLRTLGTRAPFLNVILYPAAVQGDAAEAELMAALSQANGRREADVLLLVRGGGSLSDLWTYNREDLARAVAASDIPVVSGVGHESDVTIADLVADCRAATPTAAAVAVTANWVNAAADVDACQGAVVRSVQRLFEEKRRQLDIVRSMSFGVKNALVSASWRFDAVSDIPKLAHSFFERKAQEIAALAARLPAGAKSALVSASWRFDAVGDIAGPLHAFLERKSQQTESAAARLPAGIKAVLQEKALQLQGSASALTPPPLGEKKAELDSMASLLVRLQKGNIALTKERLKSARARLKALNVDSVVERGFALVTNREGKILKSAADVSAGEALHVRLSRGSVDAAVTGIQKEKQTAP